MSKQLSIIIPSYFSSGRIEVAYNRLTEILGAENIPFELVVVDDGSTDDSYALALELERRHDNVHAYQLSRNCTAHYAVFAGLSLCSGDCAMVLPDDEQQPYPTVVEAYRLWERGEKVVIPYRRNRDDPWRRKFFSLMFYRMMNRYSDVQFPPGGADVFLIDKEVIDIINSRIHPIRTTTLTEILRLGFSPAYMPFDRPLGLNEKGTRWTFRKRVRLAKDFFFTSSSFPIRLITRLGMFFSVLAVLMILLYAYIYIFGNKQFWGVPVPGWTSVLIMLSLLGGLILFSLGVISEYILRIYDEVKARPGYIVRKK